MWANCVHCNKPAVVVTTNSLGVQKTWCEKHAPDVFRLAKESWSQQTKRAFKRLFG